MEKGITSKNQKKNANLPFLEQHLKNEDILGEKERIPAQGTPQSAAQNGAHGGAVSVRKRGDLKRLAENRGNEKKGKLEQNSKSDNNKDYEDASDEMIDIKSENNKIFDKYGNENSFSREENYEKDGSGSVSKNSKIFNDNYECAYCTWDEDENRKGDNRKRDLGKDNSYFSESEGTYISDMSKNRLGVKNESCCCCFKRGRRPGSGSDGHCGNSIGKKKKKKKDSSSELKNMDWLIYTIRYMDYRRLRRRFNGIRKPISKKIVFIITIFCLILISWKYFKTSYEDNRLSISFEIQTSFLFFVEATLAIIGIIIFAKFQTRLSLHWPIYASYIFIICACILLIFYEKDKTDKNSRGENILMIYGIVQLSLIIIVKIITCIGPLLAIYGFFCPCTEHCRILKKKISTNKLNITISRYNDFAGMCGNNFCCFCLCVYRSFYRLINCFYKKFSNLRIKMTKDNINEAPFSHQLRYKGKTDIYGRPHGYGEWIEDHSYGEKLRGFWFHGYPVGPFISQEVGSGSLFVNTRVGFAACVGKDWSDVRYGVSCTECSISGHFFNDFPLTYFFNPKIEKDENGRLPMNRYDIIVKDILKENYDDILGYDLKWCFNMLKVNSSTTTEHLSNNCMISLDHVTMSLKVHNYKRLGSIKRRNDNILDEITVKLVNIPKEKKQKKIYKRDKLIKYDENFKSQKNDEFFYNNKNKMHNNIKILGLQGNYHNNDIDSFQESPHSYYKHRLSDKLLDSVNDDIYLYRMSKVVNSTEIHKAARFCSEGHTEVCSYINDQTCNQQRSVQSNCFAKGRKGRGGNAMKENIKRDYLADEGRNYRKGRLKNTCGEKYNHENTSDMKFSRKKVKCYFRKDKKSDNIKGETLLRRSSTCVPISFAKGDEEKSISSFEEHGDAFILDVEGYRSKKIGKRGIIRSDSAHVTDEVDCGRKENWAFFSPCQKEEQVERKHILFSQNEYESFSLTEEECVCGDVLRARFTKQHVFGAKRNGSRETKGSDKECIGRESCTKVESEVGKMLNPKGKKRHTKYVRIHGGENETGNDTGNETGNENQNECINGVKSDVEDEERSAEQPPEGKRKGWNKEKASSEQQLKDEQCSNKKGGCTNSKKGEEGVSQRKWENSQERNNVNVSGSSRVSGNSHVSGGERFGGSRNIYISDIFKSFRKTGQRKSGNKNSATSSDDVNDNWRRYSRKEQKKVTSKNYYKSISLLKKNRREMNNKTMKKVSLHKVKNSKINGYVKKYTKQYRKIGSIYITSSNKKFDKMLRSKYTHKSKNTRILGSLGNKMRNLNDSFGTLNGSNLSPFNVQRNKTIAQVFAEEDEWENYRHQHKEKIVVEGWQSLSLKQNLNIMPDEIVIYIHGYNVKLHHGCSQLAHLVSFSKLPSYIQPFVFHWEGAMWGAFSALSYPVAKKRSEMAVLGNSFKVFIQELINSGIKNVHLISHSCGSRLFFNGFASCVQENLFYNVLKNKQPNRKKGTHQKGHGKRDYKSGEGDVFDANEKGEYVDGRGETVENGYVGCDERGNHSDKESYTERGDESDDENDFSEEKYYSNNTNYSNTGKPNNTQGDNPSCDLGDYNNDQHAGDDSQSAEAGKIPSRGKKGRKGKKQIIVKTIILLNPDYGLDKFLEKDFFLLRSHCNHIVMYGDTRDQALTYSETWNREKCLGKSIFKLKLPLYKIYNYEDYINLNMEINKLLTGNYEEKYRMCDNVLFPNSSYVEAKIKEKQRREKCEPGKEGQNERQKEESKSLSLSIYHRNSHEGVNMDGHGQNKKVFKSYTYDYDDVASCISEDISHNYMNDNFWKTVEFSDTSLKTFQSKSKFKISTALKKIRRKWLYKKRRKNIYFNENSLNKPYSMKLKKKTSKVTSQNCKKSDTVYISFDKYAWLDMDVIDTTFVETNVDFLKHSFYQVKREIIDDIREVLISNVRAHERVSRLDRRRGNVFVLRVAPAGVGSLHR
ncbi:conserved Plasmodium protein, unknown function [Plasmodium ovale wallikeri]|uniref:Uncharacterized protein n=1 Tax=Plasmodium ovale wallikeri TaxID=864142 RepID=A0A1A8Z1R1_PLAOA|nr:conserved Plasmodium protein, unknown function [Plasmodium ovale wallikeri]